jgi:hypothetical protein
MTSSGDAKNSFGSSHSIPQPTLLSSGSFSDTAPVEPGAPLIGLSSRLEATYYPLSFSSTPMSNEDLLIGSEIVLSAPPISGLLEFLLSSLSADNDVSNGNDVLSRSFFFVLSDGSSSEWCWFL